MSANASDLKDYYSESLVGVCESFAVDTSSKKNVKPLERGRYAVRFIGMAGATTVWLRQGDSNVSAQANTPSHPFEFANAPDARLATIIVADPEKDGYLAGILNAGTATLVLSRISRPF